MLIDVATFDIPRCDVISIFGNGALRDYEEVFKQDSGENLQTKLE